MIIHSVQHIYTQEPQYHNVITFDMNFKSCKNQGDGIMKVKVWYCDRQVRFLTRCSVMFNCFFLSLEFSCSIVSTFVIIERRSACVSNGETSLINVLCMFSLPE